MKNKDSSELIKLLDDIKEREDKIKDKKTDKKTTYKKIYENIQKNIEQKKSNKNKTNDKDIIEALKIIGIAYQNKMENEEVINIFNQKKKIINEKMQQKYLLSHSYKEFDASDDNFLEKDSNEDELLNDFEFVNSPILPEIIEECQKIKNFLDEKKEEDCDEIKEYKNDLLSLINKIDNFKRNKDPVDGKRIKRLYGELNIIKKEYNKIKNEYHKIEKEYNKMYHKNLNQLNQDNVHNCK